MDPRISALCTVLAQLKGRDAEFATSLIEQYNRRGGLSEKQWPWTVKLWERASGHAPVRQGEDPAPKANLKPLQDLFDKAGQALKRPRIRLEADGHEFVIRAAGEESRNPGYLYVMADGEYVGKIDPQGLFYKGRECSREIENQLRAFSENPLREAKAYGMKTGNCCFCAKELTDPRSVHHGWGPICAEKWGLPWGDVD